MLFFLSFRSFENLKSLFSLCTLGSEVLVNISDSDFSHLSFSGFGKLAFRRDGLDELWVDRVDVFTEVGFEVVDVFFVDLVEETSDTGEDA